MIKLTRTVVVPSVVLTKRKWEIVKELESVYEEVVRELVTYGFKNNVKSFIGLKKCMYHELRRKYLQLPSHYIHTACQDASTRIKSFLKLKRKKLTKSDKPLVNKTTIWLDDHLWKPIGYTAIKVATHKGWITIELQPHKLYWKYINGGWKLRTQPKLKIKQRRVYVYFTFEKEIEIETDGNVTSVDVNEGNVTVKVLNKVYLLQIDIKKLTLGYANYREIMQSIKSNKHIRRVIHGRERNRKKDRRYKVANVIANIAKQLNVVVVLEDLSKRCPRNMVSNIKDKKLRHRVYQAGFRSLIKVIEEKCLENGVHVVKVNPRGTSSACPFCNSKLMRGDAPRQLKCSKCNVEIGRDVVAVLNLEKRYLTLKGHMPFALMPDESTLEVAVLPMKEWMRRKPLPLMQHATVLNKMKR